MKKYLYLYVVAFSAAIISSVTIYALADILDVLVMTLTRDPYRAAKAPPYYGYISQIGSTIWLITGTATLTTALIARKALSCRVSDLSPYRIILLGGIIGLFMALDDILLFHDEYADILGIPEILFHLFYGAYMLSLIVYSRNVLRLTPWLLFFSALFCFACSSVVDEILYAPTGGNLSETENVFKFCGVVLFAFYFLYVSWDFISKYDTSKQSNT